MTRQAYILSALWVLLGVLILALTSWNPTRACSPDSLFYLKMAGDWRAYDGTFPPGYPVLIAAMAFVSKLPLLWASKLVNWLAVGLSAWLWASRVGAGRAKSLLLIWLLPGNLRILTYTWSETVFIVLQLETVWALYQLEQNPNIAFENRLAILMAGLVWMRYVGVFLYIGLVLRWAVNRIFFIKSPRNYPINWGQLFFWGLSLVGLLVGLNLYLTGQPFGGPRLLTVEPWPEWFRMLGHAVLNEVLLYNLRPGVDLFVAAGAVIGQLGLLIGIGQKMLTKPKQAHLPDRKLNRWLVWCGGVYFLALFLLRAISPFDPLNERLMAPGSFCWLLAGVWWVQSQHSMMSKSPERAEIRTNPS